jgi:hypothetical protein
MVPPNPNATSDCELDMTGTGMDYPEIYYPDAPDSHIEAMTMESRCDRYGERRWFT